MLIAQLEKRAGNDPRDTWWLVLEDGTGYESVHLAQAIESQAIVHRAINAQIQKLVIDLTLLNNFDSQGLQLLLILYKQLSDQNIILVLRNPNHFLQRIFRILQVDRFLEIETGDGNENS